MRRATRGSFGGLLLTATACSILPACGGEDSGPGSDADVGTNADVVGEADGEGGGDADGLADADWEYDGALPPGDWFVAVDGDDDDPGTEAEPFATVQRAHDAAEAGDVIFVRGGTYEPTAPTIFRREGTAEEPIVLRSYPGETVIIDGGLLPDGDIDGASTPTWSWDGAKHWQVVGPLHLTNGRGAGVALEGETEDVDFVLVESSYNGRRASRGAHGFYVGGVSWADVRDVRFIHCDAHHNANHRTIPGEDVAENLYQHGDGFRIMSGVGVQLIGCRAWNNLDDGYDLTQAPDPILLDGCWATQTGRDDAEGTITGTPGFEAAWGEGIKLTYDTDGGRHRCVRCLSWRNVHLGYRMDGGPNELLNSSSYRNGRRALGWSLGTRAHTVTNCLDHDTYRDSILPPTTVSTFNTWDAATGVTVTDEDFLSLDDSRMLGPRESDGRLPVTDFLRLAPGSDLIDRGTDVGLGHNGAAPDLGCFESP